MPFALDDGSEPEPDVAVVVGRPRDFRDHHPESAQLLVEVAYSTLSPLTQPDISILVDDLLS